MHHITQRDFITMLIHGKFFQEYIEGIGIACIDTMMVLSSSPPRPSDTLAIQKNRYCYHPVQKLAIAPLRVLAPPKGTVRSDIIMELYKKTYRPNFSPELNTWVERLQQEAKSEIDSGNKVIKELYQEIKELNTAADARKIQRKKDKIARLEKEKREYAHVLNEIDTLAVSDQRYDVRIDNSHSTSTVSQGMEQ